MDFGSFVARQQLHGPRASASANPWLITTARLKPRCGPGFKGHKDQVLRHPYEKEGITVDKAATIVAAEILSISAMSLVDQPVVTALPRLKLIATQNVGVAHIDLAFAKVRGIAVSNVPVYGDNTVAGFTFGLILSLAHRLSTMFERSKQEEAGPGRGARH